MVSMFLWGTEKLFGWWGCLDWVHAGGQHGIQNHPVMRVLRTYFANLMQNCVKYSAGQVVTDDGDVLCQCG